MLLPREQSPWNCGYYLGAIALKALNQSPQRKADLLELQRRMSDLAKRSISPTQVIAAAAWLFLIDAVQLSQEGLVERCD